MSDLLPVHIRDPALQLVHCEWRRQAGEQWSPRSLRGALLHAHGPDVLPSRRMAGNSPMQHQRRPKQDLVGKGGSCAARAMPRVRPATFCRRQENTRTKRGRNEREREGRGAGREWCCCQQAASLPQKNREARGGGVALLGCVTHRKIVTAGSFPRRPRYTYAYAVRTRAKVTHVTSPPRSGTTRIRIAQ